MVNNMPIDISWRLCRAAAALGLALAAVGCDDSSTKPEAPPPPAPKSEAQPEATAEAKPSPDVVAQPAGSTPPASAAIDPAVATLGSISVSTRELRDMLTRLPEAERERLAEDRTAVDRLLRTRLMEKALVEQARNLGWAERAEIRRQILAAQDQIMFQTYLESVSKVPDSYPSEAELQAAYDQNKERLLEPARYRISQIFLSAPYGDAAAVEKVRKQAAELAKRASAPKADFAELAKSFSDDAASAARGGDTGYLPLNQIVPELRSIVQDMEEGQISDPIQLPGGFHVIKLTSIQQARTPPLAEMKPGLRNALRSQRQEQAARAYLAGLLNAGTVTIDGKALTEALEDSADAVGSH